MAPFSKNIRYEDSVLLDRIYDDICEERDIYRGSVMSAVVAKALMFLIAEGVSDEGDIRSAMEIYLDHVSRKKVLN